ncbi:MAG: energy transducer TonB [Ruminobacter sp.]|uniref:energy transducer TonB n=1 Tax=Ruminobacter sp. TaxID=2774296 RepID=UPI001B43125B|nr:energy transducer TonB [Ruminobacter sp.]MBP3748719.1 energy transducer TonB [Ruminobacter sp.]
MWAGHVSSQFSFKSDEEIVKIMLKVLPPPPEPVPVMEVPSVPEPAEPQVLQKPEAPIVQQKPEEKPKPKPKPKQMVKKPKPVKKKTPEPKSSPEVITDRQQVNPAAAPAVPVSGKSVPAASSGPVTMVYGKTQNALMSRIVQSLLKHRYYPQQARRRGIQGVVLVSFVIRKDGTVDSIAVVKSSTGADFLKQAAVTTVKNASRDFPNTGKDIKVVVPIEFKLS